MYTQFAEVYDELMADVDYPAWANFYAKLLALQGIGRGSRICECACGTGGLTIPLKSLGYAVTGMDLSQEMLWVAAQKARAQGVQALFVRQDMRKLRLHRPVDAVLATCDGVNYLLTEEDLESFFASAYDAIRPGGALIFDVSTPYKLEHTLGDRTICEDTPHVTYMWQNRWQARTGCVDMQLCIFVREADGRYRRIDEEQRQRAWLAEELAAALKRAGFEDMAFYGNGTLTPPKPDEERWHIAARKRNTVQEG